MAMDAQSLYDWLVSNWGKKIDYYSFDGIPPETLIPSKEAFGYDTTNNKWYQWNKTEWNDLGSGGGLTPVVKNTSFTASVNTLYLVDCSSSVITISLPSTASLVAGDIIEVIDIKGNSTVNNITLDFITATQKLEGEDNNFILDDNGSYFRFIWSGDSVIGWKIVPEGLVGGGSSTSSSNIMSFPYAEDISTGTVVELINDAGTAKVQNITRLNSTPTQILGSGTQNTISIDSTSYPYNCIIPVGGNYVVIAYVKTTGVYIRLGTVVGTTVTLQGSEIQVSNTTIFYDMIPLDDEHFAIGYGPSSSPKIRVGKISGTTISLSLEATHGYTGCTTYKLGKVNASRIIMVAHNSTILYYHTWNWATGTPPTITSVTANGTTISPSWSGNSNNQFSIAFDGTGRFMYTTYPNGSGYYGAFEVDVNGNIIIRGGNSFSDANYIVSSMVAISSTLYLGVTYSNDDIAKVRLFSFVGTGTPSILSTQTITTFADGYCDSISVALLANEYATVVVKNNTILTQKLYIIQYSGTAITNVAFAGDIITDITATTSGVQNGRSFAVFPSTNIAVAVGYKNTPSIVYKAHQIGGLIVDFLGTIGISQETKLAGESGNVALLGAISSAHNGLTPATNYYISSTGDIATTQTPYLLGRSLSSTQMLLTRGMY